MSLEIWSVGTKINPRITFDPAQNSIEISGWSFSENPSSYYTPIIEKIHQSEEAVKVKIQLQCFNTASSKCLMDVAVALLASSPSEQSNQLIWGFDASDPESQEWGEDIATAAGVIFNYEAVDFSHAS
jgi:hypothetical protein